MLRVPSRKQNDPTLQPLRGTQRIYSKPVNTSKRLAQARFTRVLTNPVLVSACIAMVTDTNHANPQDGISLTAVTRFADFKDNAVASESGRKFCVVHFLGKKMRAKPTLDGVRLRMRLLLLEENDGNESRYRINSKRRTSVRPARRPLLASGADVVERCRS